MAVYISVQTDAFAELDAQRRQPQDNVRRPLRGIEIKEDTYGILRAITSTGDEIPLFDSSSPSEENGIGRSSHYSNFIIQTIQEQRVEKQQIVETFGEDYIFFFGERPRFLNVSGILLNTKDFNWKSEFWANYDQYLRGTKLVEQNARLYLYFDDVVVEGYIVSAGTQQDSMNPYHLPFQFQMFVCNYAILSTVGSVFFQQDAEAAQQASQGVPTDFGGQGLASGGVGPNTTQGGQDIATASARQGASGGLTGFLASASQFLQTADFSIQNTLEVIKNTFYGRRIVVPNGLGQTVTVAPITNQASFSRPPVNQPIHTMTDEYVARGPTEAQFDQNEIQRVNEELNLRTPEQLEKKAQQFLRQNGIDASRREASYLLLGRGAFAAFQTMGAFGIRQAAPLFDQLGNL